MLKRLRAQPRRIEHETKSGVARRPAVAPASAAVEDEVRRRTVELEAALEARSRRLREFDHLAKNNLQTLASIILLKARRSQSVKARRSLLAMAERITALSTAHRLLDPADPAGGFDVGAFVKDLAGEVAAGVDPRRIAIRLDLAPLEVAERDAAPIALLINELVTNALRHAFPDERRGHVAITVGAQGRIVVADNGVGLDAAAPSREAFGRSLAEMLARQIGAELRFEDAEPGTRAVVVLLRRAPAGA
jgi:two-component sensor histidine kinase